MMKFKVGDKVKVCGEIIDLRDVKVKNASGCYYTYVLGEPTYGIRVRAMLNRRMLVGESQITFAIDDNPKFKVGDRVVIKCIAHHANGKVGTIGGYMPDVFAYRIEFDDGEWGWYTAESIELNALQVRNIIFVTHDDDKQQVKRKYIFGIENGVKVRTGDKLWADTRYGKKLVTAYCEPFEVNQQALNQLSKIFGGHGTLKYITGRAVKTYLEEIF